MLRRVFHALQYRDFRLLWTGSCISSIGTWMQKLAQSWLVLEISDSKFLLGLDAFLGEIPIFLFSLLGGVVADRRSRRHLLIVSQLIQFTCAVTLTVLVLNGLSRVWPILMLSFFAGLAQSFGGPAHQALLPSLVKSEDLSNAIALNSMQFNVARVIGPVLGGLALKQLGAAWCFGLNSLSFLPVTVALLLIRTSYQPVFTGESMMASLRQGFGFIQGRTAMVSLIVLAFLITALSIPLIVFLPVFAKDVFQRDAETYTLLLAVSGVGSVCGAVITAGAGNTAEKGRKSLILLISLGVLMTAFSLSPLLPLSCVLLFLWSAVLIAVFTLLSSLVQLTTPDQMRGRVMSVYNVAFRGGMPFGSLSTGWLSTSFAAPAVLAVYGVLQVCVGAYFLLIHRKAARL